MPLGTTQKSFPADRQRSPSPDLRPIRLPKPRTAGGKSALAALNARATNREIGPELLSRSLLSTVLWAAFGVNRLKGPFGGRGRTAASASNSQEIDLYVALPEGIYLYEAAPHRLMPVAVGDLRDLSISRGQRGTAAGRAPLNIIYVADIARYKALGMDDHIAKPIDWPLLFSTLARHIAVAHADRAFPTLDGRTLAELRSMFGRDAAQELVDLFAVELDSRMAALSSSNAGKTLAAEAHALASAAKSIGCAELSHLCKTLERKVLGGSDDISAELAAILVAARRASEAIHREIGLTLAS